MIHLSCKVDSENKSKMNRKDKGKKDKKGLEKITYHVYIFYLFDISIPGTR